MRLPSQMNLIECTGSGGPEVLHPAQGPVPQPQAGEVLIRVRAAGVSRPDVLQRLGKYPLPPDAVAGIGLEVAGEIAALGPGAQGFEPGEPVCALTNGGGYAQFCRAPAGQVLRWPRGFDALRAAALPENFFTVWANLFQMGRLRHGESALIHGGGGGIGTTAVALAREFGARVFATVGSEAKAAACRALGADVAINYRSEEFDAVIARQTSGRGVDVILDIIGAKYLDRNLAALGTDGRLVIVGLMGGAVVEKFNLARVQVKRICITGSMLRPRTASEKARIASELRERVWPVLDAGRCAPLIHEVLPLAGAAEAHRLLEAGDLIGKIVLRVD